MMINTPPNIITSSFQDERGWVGNLNRWLKHTGYTTIPLRGIYGWGWRVFAGSVCFPHTGDSENSLPVPEGQEGAKENVKTALYVYSL